MTEPARVRLWNAEEAGVFLGVSRATVNRLSNSGDLPGVKVGRQWRFDPDLLRRWVHDQSLQSCSKEVRVSGASDLGGGLPPMGPDAEAVGGADPAQIHEPGRGAGLVPGADRGSQDRSEGRIPRGSGICLHRPLP